MRALLTITPPEVGMLLASYLRRAKRLIPILRHLKHDYKSARLLSGYAKEALVRQTKRRDFANSNVYWLAVQLMKVEDDAADKKEREFAGNL